MNRFKKEEARRYREAREGLSEEEIRELDRKEALENQIRDLAREIHFEWFPEEYDFMVDSISDAKDRHRGINPMSEDYTQRVNARRREFGVSPLGADGMPTSNESWDIAYAEAKKRILGNQ